MADDNFNQPAEKVESSSQSSESSALSSSAITNSSDNSVYFDAKNTESNSSASGSLPNLDIDMGSSAACGDGGAAQSKLGEAQPSGSSESVQSQSNGDAQQTMPGNESSQTQAQGDSQRSTATSSADNQIGAAGAQDQPHSQAAAGQDQPLAAAGPQDQSLAAAGPQEQQPAAVPQDQQVAAAAPQDLVTAAGPQDMVAAAGVQDQPQAQAVWPQDQALAAAGKQDQQLAAAGPQDQPVAAAAPEDQSLAAAGPQDQPVAAAVPQDQQLAAAGTQDQPIPAAGSYAAEGLQDQPSDYSIVGPAEQQIEYSNEQQNLVAQQPAESDRPTNNDQPTNNGQSTKPCQPKPAAIEALERQGLLPGLSIDFDDAKANSEKSPEQSRKNDVEAFKAKMMEDSQVADKLSEPQPPTEEQKAAAEATKDAIKGSRDIYGIFRAVNWLLGNKTPGVGDPGPGIVFNTVVPEFSKGTNPGEIAKEGVRVGFEPAAKPLADQDKKTEDKPAEKKSEGTLLASAIRDNQGRVLGFVDGKQTVVSEGVTICHNDTQETIPLPPIPKQDQSASIYLTPDGRLTAIVCDNHGGPNEHYQLKTWILGNYWEKTSK